MCSYSDYTRTESGLQYQDLREGTGKGAKPGAQVTVDWDGYTIGAEHPHVILQLNSTISSAFPDHNIIAIRLKYLLCLTGYYGRPFEARNKVMSPVSFSAMDISLSFPCLKYTKAPRG